MTSHDDPARVPARGPRPASDATDTAVLPGGDPSAAPPPPPPPPDTAVTSPPPEAPVPPPPEPLDAAAGPSTAVPGDPPPAADTGEPPEPVGATLVPPADERAPSGTLPEDETAATDAGDPPVDAGVVWADDPGAAADARPPEAVDRRDRDGEGAPDGRDPDPGPAADIDTAERPSVTPADTSVDDPQPGQSSEHAAGPPPAPVPAGLHSTSADTDADVRPDAGLDADRRPDAAIDADDFGAGDRAEDGPGPVSAPVGLHSTSADADAHDLDADGRPDAGLDAGDDRDRTPVTTGTAGAVPPLAVGDRYDDLSDERDPARTAGPSDTADERGAESGRLGGTEDDLVGVGAVGSGSEVGTAGPPSHDPDIGAPLVRGGDAFQGRWDDIQVDFVDDPRAAVERADGLVGDVVDEILRALATERERLAGPWRDNQGASTEDLRQAFQRYRGVFQRFLRT